VKTKKMREPRIGDVITIDHYQPDLTFRVDKVRGYYEGEGWGVDLSSLDDPSLKISTSLHEDYIDTSWWRFVQ
jgi:hypothetical protein